MVLVHIHSFCTVIYLHVDRYAGAVMVYRCDGRVVYGSYGEASGEAGDPVQHLSMKQQYTPRSKPQQVKNSQTLGGKRVEGLKSREPPQAVPQ